MRTVPQFTWLLLLFSLLGCGQSAPVAEDEKAIEKPAEVSVGSEVERTAAPLSAISTTRFTRMSPLETGIDFINKVQPDHPMNRLYHSGFVCGGVAVGDLDGDGLVDIYVVSGPDDNRLFRQTSNLKFEDITGPAQVHGDGAWGAGVTMLDIDNDGDLDIYVCNYDAPNHLYINDGKARFTEAAKSWKLDISDASLMAMPSDYDNDGDLDIYLLTNRLYSPTGRPQKPPVRFDSDGKPHVLPEFERYFALTQNAPGKFGIDAYGRDDILLKNNGDGTFSDVTEGSGIVGHGYGLSATWWDHNQDGLADIYVCNDFDVPDKLYQNNGDGTFKDVLADAFPHTSWFSMGSDAGDVNNDGLMDFIAVDMSATNHFKQKTTMGAMNAAKLAAVAGPPPQLMRNSLFINTGATRFLESGYLSGVADSDWSWAAKLADLDNDGWLDLFISNGMVRNFNDSDIPFHNGMLVGRTAWDIYRDAPTRPEQNLAFRNQGDLKFEDVSRQWGLDHVGMSYATALCDLDNDGDLDLVTANVDEPLSIWRNNSRKTNWITFSLRGKESNRYGIGANLILKTSAGEQTRRLTPTTGFLSCNQPIVHFGLGDATSVEKLTIRWPSGNVQEVTDLSSAKHHLISESGSKQRLPSKSVTPMFRSEQLSHAHREKPFDDFARQPLLPNKLSQLGPGIACGDVNGDGLHDYYVGGAAAQTGVLLVCVEGGDYETRIVDKDAANHEDMGSLLFDADGDGDLDLYVVSGGVECKPGAGVLQDRLYMNDGQGRFARDRKALPQIRESGGPVCAVDFDHDGDLDLFVGGRVIPGQYPLSPKSQLLLNDRGKFTNVIADLAPDLESAGLISGAVWTDLNSDGWVDLALATEWGPVQTFINHQGRLASNTKQSGVGAETGWWNGVTSRDLDGDGDMDLVATNFGLNTKYHASADHPALLYYGDFENQGRNRLVEAEFEDEKLFPIRGRSCSTAAMPFLGNKYRTYHDFAVADLGELYTKECLQESHRYAAQTLETGVFVNSGQGGMSFRPLPALAQISPGFGVIASEIDGDGISDIYIVQNFFNPQPETGRMDSGMSVLLRGVGGGEFEAVSPSESGLVVTGDAKSVVRTTRDGQSDVMVGVNDDRLLLARQNQNAGTLVTVRLRGSNGNRQAVGARVMMRLSNESVQTDEVRAGDGYLSQGPAEVVFGVPREARPTGFDIVWPDGTRSNHSVDETSPVYEFSKDN